MKDGKPVRVEIPMEARLHGNRFDVVVRAMRRDAGLLESPSPLGRGEQLVLLPRPQVGAPGVLQLFSKVEGPHQQGNGLYVVRWEKLTSPAGTKPLFAFLQEQMHIPLSPLGAMVEQQVVGEMVYFDFGRDELHLPSRHKVIGRNEPSDVVRLQVESERMLAESNRRSKPAETPPGALPAATVLEQPGDPDDVVEMFGVKVSRKNWEQLEDLQFSGTYSGTERTVANPGSHRREPTREQPHPVAAKESKPEPEGSTVKRLLRKWAGVISGEE